MLAGLLLACALGAHAQLPPSRPQPPPSGPGRTSSAEAIDLWSIAGGQYDRRDVRTRGTLETLEYPTYWQLSDGGVRVALVLVPEIVEAIRSLAGRRVEVVGLVRRLPYHQAVLPCGPETFCEHPDLPALPDLDKKSPDWPKVSITIWQVMDITPFASRGRGPASGRLGAFLSGTPGDGPVTVLGRFCGAAPCGGLGPPTVAGAWAIQDGEDAVWVVGKEPRGKGFRLDPAYAGDRVRWLEVTGKLERCGADWCLRARRLALARAPESPERPE